MATRYGAAYARLRLELNRTSADVELAQMLQVDALRNTIDVAQKQSRFYRELMLRTFGGPIDSRSFDLSDLIRLPTTSRENVAEGPENFLVVDPRNADLRQTSGSSGRPPLRIYLDRIEACAKWHSFIISGPR